MTGRDALWRAVLEDPRDDAVRLVFADWLEEHGDAERAEFIRAQVERARLDEADTDQADLARFLASLTTPPRWLTGAEGGHGFAQVAELLLTSRQ